MKINKSYAKKKRTRSNLIDAALKLMGETHGLEFLSIREVAKEAGIVPAAFYRHFPAIEDLGLAIVDEVGLKLRAILREARKKGLYVSQFKDSLEMFFGYVEKNRILFRFIVREKEGGSAKIREAIRREMFIISSELGEDLNWKNTTKEERLFLAEFVVSTVFHLAGPYLDCQPGDKVQERKIKLRALFQILFIYKGFQHTMFKSGFRKVT